MAVPASADAAAPKILAPAKHTLVKDKSVRVRVRAGDPGFEAIVRNVDVTDRFSAPRPGGIRVARLRRGSELAVGLNSLVVSTITEGRRIYAARSFVVGNHKRGALEVTRDRGRRATLRVSLRARSKPFDSVRLTLNGKRVRTQDWAVGHYLPSREWPLAALSFRAHLGAGHGLRPGRNRLVVTAWREDGSFDREVVDRLIPRRQPIADASGAARVPAGTEAALDARGSRAPRGASYRWRVVRAPRGANPILGARTTTTPTLVPDEPGRYRVRLDVRGAAPGRAARRGVSSPRRAPASSLSTDEVTVLAAPEFGPIGARVETMAEGGGITVGDTTYPPPPGWLQVLVLERHSLGFVANKGFGGGTVTRDVVEEVNDYLLGLDYTQLVILSGGGRDVAVDSGDLQLPRAIDEMVALAGGQPEGIDSWPDAWNDTLETGRWSLLGVPSVQRSATQNLYGMLYGERAGGGSRPGEITGYLQLDAHNNFAFASAARTTIDTSADPLVNSSFNQIRIADQIYTSEELSEGQGGFHVLVLDSLLEPTFHQTYATTEDSGAPIQSGVIAMQEALAQIGPGLGGPGYLVIVQSIGEPSGGGPNWIGDGLLAHHGPGDNLNAAVPRNSETWFSEVTGQSLAAAIGEIGGPVAHDHIAQMIGSDSGQPDPSAAGSYSLVASTGQLNTAGETLSVLSPPGPVSRNSATSHATSDGVRGTLVRDRLATWALSAPAWADFPLGSVDEIAFQEPVEWPLTGTTEELNANQYLAKALKLGDETDIRANYYGDSGADWSNLSSEVLRQVYPGEQAGFSEETFTAMQEQLSTEMSYVDNVLTLVKDWQEIFVSEQTTGQVALQSIASDIQKEIDAIHNSDSSDDSTDAEVEAIIGESIWVGSSLAQVSGQEEFADGTAVAASVFDLMGDISADSTGVPSNAEFSGKVADVGKALNDKLTDTQTMLGRLGEILVSDWGKLQAANAQVNDAWAWNTSDQASLADTITRTANAEFWKTLLPVVYGVYVVDVPYLNQGQNHDAPNPFELVCDIDDSNSDNPLGDGADNGSSWITMPVGFGEQGTDATATIDWFGLTFPTGSSDVSPGGVTHRAQSAPGAWTGNFFQPVSSGNDALLGMDVVEFFADDRFKRRWFYCQD